MLIANNLIKPSDRMYIDAILAEVMEKLQEKKEIYKYWISGFKNGRYTICCGIYPVGSAVQVENGVHFQFGSDLLGATFEEHILSIYSKK